MRPLFHPSIEEITVEAILHALADPVRVALYAEIVASACPRSCSSLMGISEKAVPKSTLSQHFNVLREAGLIHSERRGVEMQNSSRCAEIERRFPPDVETAAFRIVQEALTNVARHAAVSRAIIRIRASAEILSVEIVVDEDHPGPVKPIERMIADSYAIGGQLPGDQWLMGVVRWTWLPLPRLCSRSPRRRERQRREEEGQGKKG